MPALLVRALEATLTCVFRAYTYRLIEGRESLEAWPFLWPDQELDWSGLCSHCALDDPIHHHLLELTEDEFRERKEATVLKRKQDCAQYYAKNKDEINAARRGIPTPKLPRAKRDVINKNKRDQYANDPILRQKIRQKKTDKRNKNKDAANQYQRDWRAKKKAAAEASSSKTE